MRFRLYERGRMVDEYLSVPTFYGELSKGDELALAANPTLVSRLTGADRDEVRRIARTAARPPTCRRPGAVRAARAADGARAVRLIDARALPVLRARADRARREATRLRDRRDRSHRPACLGLRAEPDRARADSRRRVRAAGVRGDHGVPRGALPADAPASRGSRCARPGSPARPPLRRQPRRRLLRVPPRRRRTSSPPSSTSSRSARACTPTSPTCRG